MGSIHLQCYQLPVFVHIFTENDVLSAVRISIELSRNSEKIRCLRKEGKWCRRRPSTCHRSIYPNQIAECMQCAVHVYLVYMYMPCASCDSLKQAVAFSAFSSIQLLALVPCEKFAQGIKTIQVRNDRKFSKCSVTMDKHVQVCAYWFFSKLH